MSLRVCALVCGSHFERGAYNVPVYAQIMCARVLNERTMYFKCDILMYLKFEMQNLKYLFVTLYAATYFFSWNYLNIRLSTVDVSTAGCW